MSAAFYVVKIDNLTNLFNSIFDAARWPVQVFRGVLRWIFTFLIPLALMTTLPRRGDARSARPHRAGRFAGGGGCVCLAFQAGLVAEHRPVHLGTAAEPGSPPLACLTARRPRRPLRISGAEPGAEPGPATFVSPRFEAPDAAPARGGAGGTQREEGKP